jgi:hypothetical protein
MELAVCVPAGLVLQQAHKPDLARVKFHGYDFHNIANGIIRKIFTIVPILRRAVVVPSFLVLLQDLEAEMRALEDVLAHLVIVKLLLKPSVEVDQSQKKTHAGVDGTRIPFELLAELFLDLLHAGADALGHQEMRFLDSDEGGIVVCELRVDCAKLKVVSGKFLLHPRPGAVDGLAVLFCIGAGDEGAALRGGLSNELIVVVDDAFQVVGAVIELPQLLVDGGLVMQDINDEFLIDILA